MGFMSLLSACLCPGNTLTRLFELRSRSEVPLEESGVTMVNVELELVVLLDIKL